MNRVGTTDEFSKIAVPSSLRTVQPFLDEALRYMRRASNPRKKNAQFSINCKKIALSCINFAFKMKSLLFSDIEKEEVDCLDEFLQIRNQILEEMRATGTLPTDVDEADLEQSYHSTEQSEEWGTYELLVGEAEAVLALADQQRDLGFKSDAMLSYHTSSVFLRVMETMIPSKATSKQHARLMHAANNVRQCSSLYQNIVRENLTGGSCSEFYEVHGSSKLGKGSYGSVYLATHRVTQDERAVKVMNVDRITSYYLRKLHIEMAILKSIDHPNIIKIQDVFFGKRSVYLVTDLCRGGELFELLNSGKNQGLVFREDRASHLMRDMLSAVNYLHENGVIHRDLKLENFLFEDHNSNSPLILIDFGLSRHYDPKERLTQKVGSCYYTAPEVLNGNYDHRCDVWSLGVLCYMLLTGTPPFYGRQVEDVYNSILTKEASFTDKKFQLLSNSCMDFLKRLLVRDVRYRITTQEALKHPFITGASFFPKFQALKITSDDDTISSIVPTLPTTRINSIMDSLMVFMSCDSFIRIVVAMCSHTLCSDELRRFREEFKNIDRDRLGHISFNDFNITFSASDYAKNVNLKELFLFVSRGKEYISYHDYIAASMHNRLSHMPDKNRIMLLFSYLDTEDKGVIDIKSITKYLGEDIPVQEISNTIQHVSGGKNFMSQEVFYKHWTESWVEASGLK